VSETLERLQASLADRYRLERELGAGGMATVFLAQDIKHGREVAIKVLHPELGASIGSERFDREIRLAAKLQHPHILGLFDSGEANGLLYYVMPFVRGESLRDRLDREQQLPVEDAIHIALEVADALGYAHEQGVVHRDIKPENILLAGGHCLVADFGIARAATEAGEKLTQTGMAVGTPLYMSPEQSMGDTVGPTADIYSLGCVLYEMLAGSPPFTGPNARAIMARHAMTPVPGLQDVRASVPDEVEEAVMAALAKVPADRPQTAKAFCELMGTPLGATATRRAGLRMTSTRNSSVRMTAEQFAALQAMEAPARLAFWRRPVVWAAVLVLIAGALGVWKLRSGPGSGAILSGPDPHDIAVLYFEDLSPTHDLGYLADGLTEGLIGALSEVRGLMVISRGGSAQFRGATIPRDSIARVLQVGTLIMGSVEAEGGNIRVTVRLMDGSGAEFDHASFEQPVGNALVMSDSVAQEAARLIRVRLKEEIRVREQRAATDNPDAWAVQQRAELARKRGDSLFARGDAVGFAREYAAGDSLAAAAGRLDGRWIDPLLLRGWLDYWRSRRTSDSLPLEIARIADSGLIHAERALAVDKTDADALQLRGDLRYWRWLGGQERDPAKAARLLAGAQEDLEAATKANPGQAGAWATLSHLYNNVQGKGGHDIVFAARKALEEDAFLANADVILNRLFLANYDLGEAVEASHWCEEGQRRFPGDPHFVECQLWIMTTNAREPDPALAWKLADSLLRLTPQTNRPYQRLNGQMAVAGVLARVPALRDSARRVVKRTLAVADNSVDATHDLSNIAAFVYVLLGDKAQALDQITIYLNANPARRQGFRDAPGWWFRSISQDPRYQQIVGGGR
jgi:serine/threonine-protein kinase